ncbi:MAG: glycoside hydrolase family 99-like domain-containing protein [Prevotella sp.]|nr:glycoside hydrolase family 99-like domain-containing protein [Prevotella sp.]
MRTIAFYLPQFYPTPGNDEWREPGHPPISSIRK